MDNQEEWNDADTRSPVETAYVDMVESVTIRKLTMQEIKSATEGNAELNAQLLLSHKACQREWLKYPPSCRSTFPSEKNFQFRMVLCSGVREL